MSRRSPGPALLIFLVTSAIFLASPVHIPTDSRYSTLVSEALLRHGSLALDPWFAGRSDLPSQLEAVGGHVYSWYPSGGPVLAAPLVGTLTLLGLSAAGHGERYDEKNDVVVQAILAALLMALLSALFLKAASQILPARLSWIVALGGALGTQIWSTASRVLWGDTFLALILGAVVWLLVLHEKGRRPLSGPLLATLLAWAYFARPTASISIVAVTLYLAIHHRRLLVSYVATGAAWLAAFLAWSWLTFGTLLPTYYKIRTFSLGAFGSGLSGILLSPSRGQLIYVPATLFVLYLLVRYARALRGSSLVAPALVAVLGHTALIAAFPNWHGGHCYGPRYLTPIVPWLVLLAALGLRALLDRRARGMRVELVAGAVLLACSVFAQARGACARETWTWNTEPNDIGSHPERFWNWRDPQLLRGLLRPALPRVIPRYVLGARTEMASAAADPFLVSGWSGSEGTFRWTDGRAAVLAFGLDPVEPVVLELALEAFLPSRRVHEQRVRIELNGAILETVSVNRPGTVDVALALPLARLARENRLTLLLPDAAFAAPFGLGKDPRKLAVAVHWFGLRRPN
jgi:hypothetical protein